MKTIYPPKPEPMRIEFEITNFCNASCEFCPRFNIKEFGEMNFEKFKEFIINFREIKKELWLTKKYSFNFPTIVFGGYGEPMLNSKFDDFISFAKSNGFVTEMITNGLMLNEENCKKIISSGLDILSISLHTLENDTNKHIMGFDATNTVAKALEFFDDKNIKIEIWRVCKSDGTQYGKENNNTYKNFLCSYKKNIKVLGPTPAWNRAGQFESKYYPIVNDSKNIRCETAWFNISVSFNGDFLLCCCDFSRKNIVLCEEWDFDIEKLQDMVIFYLKNPPQMCKICRKPRNDYYSKKISHFMKKQRK